jgi:hypothetical protein
VSGDPLDDVLAVVEADFTTGYIDEVEAASRLIEAGFTVDTACWWIDDWKTGIRER